MSLSNDLPGTWLLQSRIDLTLDGSRHPDPLLGEYPVALLIYDHTGHFSAQFMKRDRTNVAPSGPSNARNNTQAQGGYDAYFGTYSIDDTTGVVTQQLMGSLSPGNVGMVLSRAMEVRGDTLLIKLETTAADGTPVVRTLTWRRLKDATR
ncbi:MAG: lipocalin-like domain-containing protein [Gammaproteobacteria bacterium]|nr:lipocalin-like domain-containing protein [Gammaproteobacteria bacterium]